MFKPWPKIPRLENEIFHITEKIEESKKVRVVITYPDTQLPAINLWVLAPAWYFYASQEERAKYYEELLNAH